jgi:hypothetical protein
MLTDEQIEDVCRAHIRRDCSKDPSGTWAHSIVFARAIEAEVRKEPEAAVLAERESCAIACDEMREYWSDHKDTALLNGDVELSNAASGEPRAAEALAVLIRARTQQAPDIGQEQAV